MNESAGQTVSPYTRLNTAVKEWSKEKMPVKAKYTTASNLARVVVLKVCIQLLMLQVTLVGNVFCGNVLIWPTEASHWLSIKVIIEEMIHRGHNVSILLSTGSLFIKPSDVPAAKFEMYPVPFGKDAIDTLIKDIIMLWLFNRPTAFTFHKFYQELGTLVSKANDLNRQMCEGVLANQELMVQLQRRKYDVLISDPVTICGDLVAVKLEIPFVYTLRFTPASTVERHCGKIPAPPSYAPAVLSELTDRLSFPERVKNMISYHVQDYVFQSYWGEWDSYYSQVLGESGLFPSFPRIIIS